MKRMLHPVVFIIVTTVSFHAYAGGNKTIKMQGNKGSVSDHNTHVKKERPATDVEIQKSRSGTVTVNCRNHTGYFVNAYVDGAFQCTIAPYSTSSVTYGGSYSSVYFETEKQTYNWSLSGNFCESPVNYDLYIN